MIYFKRNVVVASLLFMVPQLQAIGINDVNQVLGDTLSNVVNSELGVALINSVQNVQNLVKKYPVYAGGLAGFITFLICIKLWRQHMQNRTFKEVNEGYMQGFNNGYKHAHDESRRHNRMHDKHYDHVVSYIDDIVFFVRADDFGFTVALQ